MTDRALTFPPGFLWGTATSSYQVEGNTTNSDWWEFEHRPGAIWTGEHSGLACDWWRNAEIDFDLMASMGHNTHRLSVDWSRIEPEEGVFDPVAIARYRQMLLGLRQRGIEPMVTLFHWSTPLWLAHQGGWTNPAVLGYFRRLVRYVVEQLGDLVSLWCTINEPNIYAIMGHLAGIHAPGLKSVSLCLRVWRHLLLAHATAYRLIHAIEGSAQVGFVLNIEVFQPLYEDEPAAALVTRLADYLFHGLPLRAVSEGRLPFPVSVRSASCGALLESLDFMGANYYTRQRISFRRMADGRRFLAGPTPGSEAGDRAKFGSYGELYPAGMVQVLERVACLGKPIYITENGLPDHDDDQRPRYLLRHLAQVQRAIAQGIDVRGYYFWSLVDNFEWAAGWGWRFGLVALDEKTQVRTPRPSARLYEEIVRANAITPAIVQAYAPEIMAELFP